jgi:hypothetical protein
MEFLVLVVLAGCLYLAPTWFGRAKRDSMAIFALNLLGGWTVVGWVAALVWR